MLTALFGRAGHEVLTAGDGALALDILEREPIDAVVSDVRMPTMDGFQLCRAIRQDPRWKRLPFIFYSSVFIGDFTQLMIGLRTSFRLEVSRVAGDAFTNLQVWIRAYLRADIQLAHPEAFCVLTGVDTTT